MAGNMLTIWIGQTLEQMEAATRLPAQRGLSLSPRRPLLEPHQKREGATPPGKVPAQVKGTGPFWEGQG